MQGNTFKSDKTGFAFKPDKRPRTLYAPASDGGGEVAMRLNAHLRGGQG